MAVGAFVRRHPLWTYFGLAFGISWGGILLALGPEAIRNGVSAEGGRTSEAGAETVLVLLAMLVGPTAAGLLTTAVVDGKAGLRELFSRLVRWRVGLRWYAVGLLTTPFALLAVLLPLMLVSQAFTPAPLTPGRTVAVAVLLLMVGLAAGFFEELGWTGFALPKLLRGRGILAVSIGFGVMHMVWHTPADYWGNINVYSALYPLHWFVWIAALIGLRLLIVRIYRHTESTLLAQLTHASSTGSQLLLSPVQVSVVGDLVWYALFVAVLWITIGVLTLGDRPRAMRGSLQIQPA